MMKSVPAKEVQVNRIVHVAVMVVAIMLFAVVVGQAQQVTKVGTTAAKFLSIPVGARATGMGGAFVAIANDASAMYWNPAGIARLSQSEAIFSHSAWIADISFNYAGVVMPVSDFGTFGVNFTSLSMTDMERTTEDQPDGTGEFFSAGSFAVGVAYAKNLTEWFSIGANVKYVNEHIWDTSATAIAVDIGTLFTTPFPGVTFGAGMVNVGQKLHMQGDDLIVQKDISPNNGNNPNVTALLQTDNFDLPLALRLGVAYEPIVTENQHLTIAVDALHPNDNTENLNLGFEYTGVQNILAIRGGYNALGQRDGESSYTVGGGLRYSMEGGPMVKFDYAFENFGRLQNVHKFSVGIAF
jgi:long-subunit fatty acid transport protein